MPDREALQEAFEAFDLNGDGFISKSEMVEILTRPCKSMPNQKPWTIAAAEAAFDKMDYNRDGLLDIDEFSESWSTDCALSRFTKPASTASVDVTPRAATEQERAFVQALGAEPPVLELYTAVVKADGLSVNAVIQRAACQGAKFKVALFLHGYGDNRCFGFWLRCFPALIAAGISCVALDQPGNGQSTGKVTKETDAAMIEALLPALGVPPDSGCVCLVGDGMGAATGVRALCAAPGFFSHNHFLMNCAISEVPPKLKTVLRGTGGKLFYIICAAFSLEDELHMVEANKRMMEFMEAEPDLAAPLRVQCEGVADPKVKSPKPLDYLGGDLVAAPSLLPEKKKAYVLRVSEAFTSDLAAHLLARRRQTPTETAGVTRTALELGQQNEHFKVYVRVRPLIKREVEAGVGSALRVSDVEDFPRQPPPQRVELRDASVGDGQGAGLVRGTFVFDRVLEENLDQAAVYEAVAQPLVGSVLGGTNVTLFAYGQTGTGKTFTTTGAAGPDEGLVPRLVRELFAELGAAGGGKEVRFNYVQLYNEEFLDLLAPGGGGGPLRLVEDSADPSAFMQVQGAAELTAAGADDLLQRVAAGAELRASSATNMNDASSRSHAVLMVKLVAAGAAAGAKGTVFSIVDLAGSERVNRSGVQGAKFDEAVSINSSLSALARVVAALVEQGGKRAKFIPYRDSKLTHLLKNGLGGNSKTALVCCVTSADNSVDETLRTLEFALNASHVKNKVEAADKKVKEAEAMDALVAAGHTPQFDGDGRCVISLSKAFGDVACSGDWSAGEGAPLVLCLHGHKSPASLDAFLPALAGAGFRVLKPDLPGHGGGSGGEPNLAKLEGEEGMVGKGATAVALLKELLDWLGAAKVTLLAQDWGAVLALQFATRHASRVERLLLDNKAARAEHPDGEYHLMERNKLASTPSRDCAENKGKPVCHGHPGFTLLLDKGVQKKLKEVAKRSLLLFPQSKSKKKSHALVKLHDGMAETFRSKLGFTVVDTSAAKKSSDSEAIEAFTDFLQKAQAA